MSKENNEAVADFPLFRRPHALHLIDQIVQIEIIEAALPQQLRLLLRPDVEVGFVEVVAARFGLCIGIAGS